MHPVQVSNDACFTVRYSTRPDKLGSQDIELSHQGKDYLLKSDDAEYKGGATPGKDVEAILIWDNDKNQYVLHFVEHNLRVSKVLKRPKQPPKSARAATPSVVATPPLSRPETELPKASVQSASESQSSDESSASDASDADDYGDLANELEGELGTLDSATVIGTAGAGVDDEEISSEEE